MGDRDSAVLANPLHPRFLRKTTWIECFSARTISLVRMSCWFINPSNASNSRYRRYWHNNYLIYLALIRQQRLDLGRDSSTMASQRPSGRRACTVFCSFCSRASLPNLGRVQGQRHVALRGVVKLNTLPEISSIWEYSSLSLVSVCFWII